MKEKLVIWFYHLIGALVLVVAVFAVTWPVWAAMAALKYLIQ